MFCKMLQKKENLVNFPFFCGFGLDILRAGTYNKRAWKSVDGVPMNEKFSEQIEQARRGDEQALAAVLSRQMPQIRSLAAKAVGPGLDYDDAVQEGLIGLLFALRTFDGGKGAAFSTYANTCVQNAVASAVRRAQRKKHAPLNTSVPYTEQESAPGPEELMLQSERYNQTMQSIDTRLSAMEKQVLALFLDGCSYSAIARRMDISEKAVDNALQRVRLKLK